MIKRDFQVMSIERVNISKNQVSLLFYYIYIYIYIGPYFNSSYSQLCDMLQLKNTPF